jgi:excisionase family DNA binding protein
VNELLQNARTLLNTFVPGSFPDPLRLPIEGENREARGPAKVLAEYLTAEEAAAYIRVHVETLRKWVRLGVFPHVPLPGVGKDYRFSRKLIDEWARNRALGKE